MLTAETKTLLIRSAAALEQYDINHLGFVGLGVTGGPSKTGEVICLRIAKEHNCDESIGMLIYLLLAYAWDEAIAWAKA